MRSILFVCMGNICRSPALAATLQHLAAQKQLQIRVDSCGLGWHHIGQHPDPRTFAVAKQRGILIDHRAQQFQASYFKEFDLIFAVDREILEQLRFLAQSEEERQKLFLATAHSPRYQDQDIPDPYYHSLNGFNEVMDMVLDACEGILSKSFG